MKRCGRGIVLILSILSIFSNGAQAQENKRKVNNFDDLKELFTIRTNKKAIAADSTLYPNKIVIAPIISYAPETSVGLGVGAKYLFKFPGSGSETRTSNMPLAFRYTFKNQFIAYSGFEIFTNQEEWVIEGNLLFQNFPRLFYGIGRDAPESNEEEYASFQALVEPILLKRMFTRYLFIGGGLRYNHLFEVETQDDGILEDIAPLGFDGSTSAGAEFAVLYDSRNNIINANTGWYVEFTHGFYGKILGGTQEFQLTRLDARYFFQPFPKRDDVLGFQLVGIAGHKDVPFAELALFGGEDILRGYIEGRYVDRNLIAAQMEYRANLYGRWGMVAFVGAGDVARNIGDFKIGNLRATVGVGLRFMLDKVERLNVRVDWGFGDETNNYYLNIGESF